MKLIYRGQTFTINARPVMPYRQPYAINWRYQVNGELVNQDLPKMTYHKPQAINWRWQIPTEYSF